MAWAPRPHPQPSPRGGGRRGPRQLEDPGVGGATNGRGQVLDGGKPLELRGRRPFDRRDEAGQPSYGVVDHDLMLHPILGTGEGRVAEPALALRAGPSRTPGPPGIDRAGSPRDRTARTRCWT